MKGLFLAVGITLGFLISELGYKLFSGVMRWDVFVYGLIIQASFLCWFVFSETPHSRMMLKSLLFAYAAYWTSDIFLYPLQIYISINVSTAISWSTPFLFGLWFYSVRRYEYKSDPFDKIHIFLIRRRPKGWLSFLMALYKDPLAGSFIVTPFAWYDFDRIDGKLVICKLDRKEALRRIKAHPDRYVVQRCKIAHRDDEDALEQLALLKTPWLPWQNCWTEFIPLAHGKKKWWR